jgi:hypothetical protein
MVGITMRLIGNSILFAVVGLAVCLNGTICPTCFIDHAAHHDLARHHEHETGDRISLTAQCSCSTTPGCEHSHKHHCLDPRCQSSIEPASAVSVAVFKTSRKVSDTGSLAVSVQIGDRIAFSDLKLGREHTPGDSVSLLPLFLRYEQFLI